VLRWLSALLARFRPLLRLPAIPGWAIVAWEVVDHSSRVEFVALKGWRVLKSVFTYLSENPNARLFIGLLWLTLVVVLPKGWFGKLTARFRSPNEKTEPPKGTEVTVADSPRGCQDEWLHEKLKTDKATIWGLVWVASIYYRRDFDKGQPCIDFVFNIFNMSLIDVVISMDGGYVLFGDDNEQFYLEPKFISQNPARCRTRDSTNFVIRQAVTRDEITNHFKEADNTRISFGNLRVTFRGTQQFPEITPTNLDVNHYLFTREGAWHNPNRPKFLSQQECKLPHVQAAQPKLLFEIDEKQSQVNTLGGGTAGRRINANIRLRCMKIAEHPMAIRELHAALLKEGHREPVVPQEGALVVMNHPDMNKVDFADGWTVNEPLTGYRWFMFYLDITEQQLQKLSGDYYMRLTMIAVGQPPLSIDFDVNNWQDARKSNSDITIRGKAA